MKISSNTKKLLISMSIIVIIGLIIAQIYYSGINKSIDPRIIKARELLVEFNNLIDEKNYIDIFPLLDTLENIYTKVPGYKESYEMGVVHVNRSAVYLSMALYENTEKEEKEKLLSIANKYVIKGIKIYENWIKVNENLEKEEIKKSIEPYFLKDDKLFENRNIEKIVNKRVKDIILAQLETPRRLSVAYTNLGIIQRHQLEQNKAIESYSKALELWDKNYTAKNNLNVLLGKPIEKRGVLDRLFPPDKNKK